MFKSPHSSIQDQQREARSGGIRTLLEQSEWEAEMIPTALKELGAVGWHNPFPRKGLRNLLLVVLGRPHQLLLTALHRVPIPRGFPTLYHAPV